ncbi:LacI family DNA-binding transcriptional regulator [Tichowtungia aerotolerans]|uniref:Substrate-binding domain-containing protein n=1 Tax=Tichowtungia aerotolerans TaxID=2697043 RepID=A0A6P1M1M6_9BACT|nr:LacI family DNA-binding transcriptional regulator [Tichowtungia aerotolerans]QHI68719.1 substrate-binding domain-containing protein [Tichowtungia aerotolerans]
MKNSAKTKRTTIQDIATLCNINKATVSRILNNKTDQFPISEKTINKVKEAAQRLNYRPNRLAQATGSQRTNLIGLSFSGFNGLGETEALYESQMVSRFLAPILSTPRFSKYDLVVHSRDEQVEKPLTESEFKTDLFDGLLYLMPSETHLEFINIASEQFPIVVMGYTPKAEETVPCIDINNRKAAQKAVTHLIETGRKSILYLGSKYSKHMQFQIDRLDGYKDALRAHTLRPVSRLIHTVTCDETSVTDFFRNLPDLDKIDGLFCPDDELAAHSISALSKLGKKIPEDIAVVGFNNAPVSTLTNPSLTTIDIPAKKVAEAGLNLLLDIIEKKAPYQAGFHEIETKLIERQST